MAISDKDFYASHGLEYNSSKFTQDYVNSMCVKTLEHLKDCIDAYMQEKGNPDNINIYELNYMIDKYIRDIKGIIRK